MPQLRKDPVVGRWVIIAAERANRPRPVVSPKATAKKPRRTDPCPFCVGNEAMTPPEALAYRPNGSKADSPGWSLRVVPNKFPALVLEGTPDRRRDGVYDSMNGFGAHEVIIETPRHEVNMGVLGEKEFGEVLRAYRDRILRLREDKRFRYILVFKNQGIDAGATLEHTHSQLIALPIVPRDVIEELKGAKEYYRSQEDCIYCAIVRREMDERARIVGDGEHFIVACPFAPRFPFETWIVPKKHSPRFEHASRSELVHLSRALKETLLRFHRALDDPPFNFILHSSPLGEPEQGYYHWHVEIMPKLIHVAGFEWGSGFYINPVAPEDAARLLRDVAL